MEMGWNQCFFGGDIYPQTLKSLGIRQNICGYVSTNFGKLWIENVEICLSEGYFWFVEPEKLKKIRLRRAKTTKQKFLVVYNVYFEKLPPVRAAKIWGTKSLGICRKP